jgi:Glycosyltransferase family 52.
VIALRIIEKLQLNPGLVEVVYISKVDNVIAKNALFDLARYGCNVRFIHVKHKYPIYFFYMQAIFFKRHFIDVYIASIDGILMQFILSKIKFQKLYTFDDGTANIFPNSIYAQDKPLGFWGAFFKWLFGIHYEMSDIKRLSSLHYTLYKEYKNIVEPLVLISLMPTANKSDETNSSYNSLLLQSECNVVLGTVYKEIFESGTNISNNLSVCADILNKTGLPTFYLPHPREGDTCANMGFCKIEATRIAEVEILDLLRAYKKIHLYGFVSSCQFNLEANPRISNYVFSSTHFIEVYRHLFTTNFLPKSFNVINLD